MDVAAERVSSRFSLTECEWAGWRGTRRPNSSREAKFSGANGDWEIFIFPVQLMMITNRIAATLPG